MDRSSLRYHYLWPAKPAIVLLTAAITLALSLTSYHVEAPFIIHSLIVVFTLLALLLAIGAAIRTAVIVDGEGNLTVSKTIAGLPITRQLFPAGTVTRVELDRQISSNPAASKSEADKPGTPRYRIDLVYPRGKFFVVASIDGDNLSAQAKQMAEALKCPFTRDMNSPS